MIINIKSKPDSGKQEIVKVSDREYKVNMKSKAEGNKANIELVKLLGRYFKKDIKIIKGMKSRNKIVEIK